MESKLRFFFQLNKLLKLILVILSLFLHFFIFLQIIRKVTVKLNTQQIIVHTNYNYLTQYPIGVLLTICMLSVLSVVMLHHHSLRVLIAVPLLYNHLFSSNCTVTFQKFYIVDILAVGFILKVQ
jgi:hypothetical protein